jgi:hypothetical protein
LYPFQQHYVHFPPSVFLFCFVLFIR